jgi:hypothetical protein
LWKEGRVTEKGRRRRNGLRLKTEMHVTRLSCDDDPE